MIDPVVIPRHVVARMPKALRVELGVETGGAEEVVAVAVPASDAPEAARMMRLLTSCFPSQEDRSCGGDLMDRRMYHKYAKSIATLHVRDALLKKRYLDRYEVLDGSFHSKKLGLNYKDSIKLWESRAEIFRTGIYHSGTDEYPAFQFDEEGRPRPEIAKVLAALPAEMSGWKVAFWFASGNGWVENGAAPQDALHDMTGVLAAAADLAFYCGPEGIGVTTKIEKWEEEEEL